MSLALGICNTWDDYIAIASGKRRGDPHSIATLAEMVFPPRPGDGAQLPNQMPVEKYSMGDFLEVQKMRAKRRSILWDGSVATPPWFTVQYIKQFMEAKCIKAMMARD